MARRKDTSGTPLVLTGRGQITLPKAVRDRLRLAGGSVLLLREENGRLVLDPAAVTPVETYTDAQIEAWVKADRLAGGERRALRRRWGISPR
jgi:AbrB family looped-hinge helix DNA binding protein